MDAEKVKKGFRDFIEKIKQFLREVKTELKKVSWPQRKEIVASTSIVLVIVIIIAIFLGLVDLGLSKIIKVILS
jgi:preprotein translocase subunit SecE